MKHTSEEVASVVTREVTENDKELLKQKLYSLKSELQVSGQIIGSELIHGLTVSVIDDVVSKCSSLFTPDDVIKNVACWSYEMASQIIDTVRTVFEEHDLSEFGVSDESDSDD